MTFGVGASPAFRESPLRHVSARALQLYVFLAAYAARVPRHQDIGGVTVSVGVYEVLASWRHIQGWLSCGRTQVGQVLAELEAIDAITVTRIPTTKSGTVPNQDRQRSQIETVKRFAISRIHVHGLPSRPANDGPKLRPKDGPKLGTRSNRALDDCRRRELAFIDSQLAAEE